MKPRFVVLGCACLTAALAVPSSRADVIASQNFNSLSSLTTFTTDSLPPGSQLTNFSAQNGNPALGITFRTFFQAATRTNATGPRHPSDGDTGDFIGVNGFAGANAPNVSPGGGTVSNTGDRNFEFNDTDGLVRLLFDPVDVAGFEELSLSLAYWINNVGYEAGDGLRIRVTDGSITETVLDFDDNELEANASPDDGSANWKLLSVNLSSLGFGAAPISLLVDADTNASDENLFIDDVLFQGRAVQAVPEPSTFALAGLGGLGLAGLVHRRRRLG